MGEASNGSGCGNETASDRVMFRKYMVDSVSYWAREYHLDGFRFDLMALHDVETMQAVEEAVHGINPHALLYGEGWTGGTSALNTNFQMTQANARKITPSEWAIWGIAVFNDAIRDGLKGSVFDPKDRGYISGQVTKGTAQKVIFGLTGGEKNTIVSWYVNNAAVINYMSCHDNNTLYDKLLLSNPDATEEERFQMARFGAEIVMISKGIPFFLAGEEMLRTKGGDANSYASPDAVNNLDWDALESGSAAEAMRDHYRALIAMRRNNPFITTADITCEILGGNAIKAEYSLDGEVIALALINPGTGSMTCPVPGTWGILMKDGAVFKTPEETLSGVATVGGRSVTLLVKP